jgi:glutamate-5-semialdehyde dehydrogenase
VTLDSPSKVAVRGIAASAKQASRVLASLPAAKRNAVLEAMATGIEGAEGDLLEANHDDMVAAEERSSVDALPPATLARLKLTKEKLGEMVAQIRSVAALPDPLGRKLDAIELDDRDPDGFGGRAIEGLRMTKVSVPLGVLAVIFEARPDAVTQIASLGIKSGNAVLLKPGREVESTAEAIVDVLRDALVSQGLPKSALSLVRGRENVAELLKAHDLVDMVIPRGSKALVEYVQANTRIPVLGHAEGVCHIYVDRSFDEAMALRVIEDAKCDYPAACNAVETVLVHRDVADEFLPKLTERLRARGVLVHMEPDDWHTEYGDLSVSVGVVDSLDAAIDHIHAHGSLHTESIITEDAEAAERFLNEVDAAGVMLNASTRFADGFRYGFGAEVGISTSKFHARGPVGLDGLTTYKYVVRGHGHVAGDYRGEGARVFTHKRGSA